MITDKDRLNFLEELAWGNSRDDVAIQWDHEDGIWLSLVNKGDVVGWSLGKSYPYLNLREAIDAAITAIQPGAER